MQKCNISWGDKTVYCIDEILPFCIFHFPFSIKERKPENEGTVDLSGGAARISHFLHSAVCQADSKSVAYAYLVSWVRVELAAETFAWTTGLFALHFRVLFLKLFSISSKEAVEGTA